MKHARLTLGVVLSALLITSAARADYIIKDGQATPTQQTVKSGTLSGGILPWYLMVDATGSAFGTSGNPFFINPGTAASWAIGATGSAVPANAHYWGVNVSGNQVGVTGLALGATTKAPTVAIVDASGNQVTAFGGAGGTASNFSSVFPTPGTAVGFSDGTNMVAGRVIAAGADAVSNSTPWLVSGGFNYVYNGTTWDRLRGDTSNGAWVNVKAGLLSAAQSGTWTVQPGNTANTTPWLFAGNVSNAASALATGSVNVGSIAYNYGFNGTTWDQFQMDASKFLKVNCAAGCTGAADTNANLSGMTANNAATQIALVGTNSVAVLLSGTWTATITPEVSADGGTTWVATQFWNVNTHVAAATVSANGTYDILGTGGKSHARVRISAFTSGTVTGNLRATSQAPSANDGQAQLNVLVSGPNPTGTNTMGNVGSDPSSGKGTPSSVPINVSTATTTQLVAISGSTKIYVTSYDVIAGGTGNIGFVYGTGTNCGTGQTSLTGSYNLTTQTGIAKGNGVGALLVVPAGNALCVLTSAAVQMSGSVSFQQF